MKAGIATSFARTRSALAALFPLRVDILAGVLGERTSSGQATSTGQVLHAQVAAATISTSTPASPELNSGPVARWVRATHKMMLDGYYPHVTDRSTVRVASAPGIDRGSPQALWQVEGVIHDSLLTLTELFIWQRR